MKLSLKELQGQFSGDLQSERGTHIPLSTSIDEDVLWALKLIGSKVTFFVCLPLPLNLTFC